MTDVDFKTACVGDLPINTIIDIPGDSARYIVGARYGRNVRVDEITAFGDLGETDFLDPFTLCEVVHEARDRSRTVHAVRS